jgi:uncharacterized membrane protein
MGGDNVEQLWYGLWLIKAIMTLFFVFVVVVLCKRFFRFIPWNRFMRRSTRHPMVHSLGAQPPRNAAALDSSDYKRRIG